MSQTENKSFVENMTDIPLQEVGKLSVMVSVPAVATEVLADADKAPLLAGMGVWLAGYRMRALSPALRRAGMAMDAAVGYVSSALMMNAIDEEQVGMGVDLLAKPVQEFASHNNVQLMVGGVAAAAVGFLGSRMLARNQERSLWSSYGKFQEFSRLPNTEPKNPDYWPAMARTRRFIEKRIDDSLESNADYAHFLSTAHKIATKYYTGTSKLKVRPGEYRDPLEELKFRSEIVPECVQTAREYGEEVKDGPLTISYSKGKLGMGRIEGKYIFYSDIHDPIREVLFRETREKLQIALETKDQNETLDNLAEYIRVMSLWHPFESVNFSLTMNVVNHVLKRKGLKPIPHFGLDMESIFMPNSFNERFKEIVLQRKYSSDGKNYDGTF